MVNFQALINKQRFIQKYIKLGSFYLQGKLPLLLITNFVIIKRNIFCKLYFTTNYVGGECNTTAKNLGNETEKNLFH